MIRSISRAWLVADVIGALFGILLTLPLSFAMMPGHLSTWMPPGAITTIAFVVIGVVQWFAAAISRLSPAIALMVAWGASILQMALGFAAQPYDLAIFFVLFATAAWGSIPVLWFGGGSAVIGGLIAGGYTTLVNVVNGDMTADAQLGIQAVTVGVLLSTLAVLSLIMAWGSGLLWRVVLNGRQTRIAQARAETLAAAEAERVRIARDMHDVVAHSLAVVIAQADGARYAAAADPAQATAALATIGQTARAALSDVRLLLAQLRHRQGDGPQPTLADLETLYAQVRAAGVEPRVTVHPMPPGEPPGAIQLAVYRILQEALTNAIRHGRGDVDVHLSWLADRVELSVVNTVRDPGHAAAPGQGGHGIVGMHERAQLVGGTLVAGREGERFVVRAALPIGGEG